MAPERPPSIAVLDLRLLASGKLQGIKEYYEAAERFHVNWNTNHQPKGYRTIHKGVAYYCLYENNQPVDKEAFVLSLREELISVSDSSYIWSEGGFEPGKPALMLILILPKKYTLVTPNSSKNPSEKKPLGAKLFKGRLAVYWIPIANSEYRADIIWKAQPFDGDILSEVQRINTAPVDLPTPSPIDLDEKESKTEIIMGNKYVLGKITNSNVNIDTTLNEVTQTIQMAPNVDDEGKKQLAELIEQLKAELQKTSSEKKDNADAIAKTAKALVDASTEAQPNKVMVQITADGLKKAAENIASVMPTILGIVKIVYQIVGIPLP